MSNSIRNVVILGGGTAGWMTAAYLGKSLEDDVTVTVLESPASPRIGVGEATVPNLQKAFFDFLGLTEDDWMPECNAAFKTAVKFINWNTPGESEATARVLNGRRDHFYHPFGILPEHDGVPLAQYWFNDLAAGRTDKAYDYACFREPAIMDANLSPRRLDGERVTRYAWHFDAQLVADFLRRFAIEKQGIIHVQDEMIGVDQDSNGFITALRTKSGRTIEGDLFVDCSGFRGLLINQVMREPFLDMSEYLINDSAVATAILHDDDAEGIEPYTSAIAMKSGWTWKIPMLGRHGTGYVYSSRFTDQDQATLELAHMWGLDPDQTTFNQIRFRVGRNRRSWVRNCVSIGLASCFLEPLESSGIYFITAAIHQLAKHLPNLEFDRILIHRFNEEIETMFDETRDFIQAHFYFAPRTDTPFWRANKELRLSDAILEKVALYRAGLPVNPPITSEETYYGNFEAEFRNFWTNGSYYSVFAGLGLLPDHPMPSLAHRRSAVDRAGSLFTAIELDQRKLVESLPTNLECLRQIHTE